MTDRNYPTNPYFYQTMMDHYEERLEVAKCPNERAFLREQLWYHKTMYRATQN